jgi:hypothetical protein
LGKKVHGVLGGDYCPRLLSLIDSLLLTLPFEEVATKFVPFRCPWEVISGQFFGPYSQFQRRDCESCGFRNVNYLLGIFCHLYLGLKVFLFLKELDEGEERLRGVGGAQQTQLKNYLDEYKYDLLFVSHGIALYKIHK